MKLRGKNRLTRKGMLVTTMVMMLGIAANTIATKYFSDSQNHYMAARVTADGFRARQLAIAGFQAGLAVLKNAPEEFLYKYKLDGSQKQVITVSPPDPRYPSRHACKPTCGFRYQIGAEDGKLNLNSLVIPSTDDPNKQMRGIFQRFFREYEFEDPEGMVDGIIDWIDENDTPGGRGAESTHYDSLKPKVKIKNFRLFNLSEVCQVKGVKYKMIFGSNAPTDWKRRKEELKFLTEDEKALLKDADWIPKNNLTAYIPLEGSIEDKININTARYHVLKALSPNMTKEAILALFKHRRQSGGYIKNLSDLRNIAEFQTKTNDLTLFDELVGSGSQLSGLIKSKGEIYRLIGVGLICPPTETKDDRCVIRKIIGLYDNNSKKLIYYSED